MEQVGIRSLQRLRRQFGWIGAVLLLLIIPIKAVRWIDQPFVNTVVIGVAPSLLGPAGLLFLVLSNSGRLSRFSLVQITLVVGAISLGLEFAQLLRRPGILAVVSYAFDWLDVAATLVSICAGYWTAGVLMKRVERIDGVT
jgi:hypothetical protein